MTETDPTRRGCAALSGFLFRHRRAALLVSLALFALLAAASTRISLSDDWVEPFLPPSDTELRSYADALHRFGDTETLYVDVGAADAETLHAAADLAELRMRASGLFARVVGRLTDADAHRTMEAVRPAVPVLLDAAGLREVESRTRPDAIAARMEEHWERLLGPVGGLWQDVLARDPLELAALVLERAGGAASIAGAHVERGRLVSRDGRHALVLGVARATVGDEAGGAALVAFFGGLESELRGGSGGAAMTWTGGHRHYAANSAALQRDLAWVSALAVALVLAVIFIGFRGARITWIALLAVAAGTVAGGAALVLAWPRCSGIALGFGAALSGISVDYVTHLHAPRRAGERREDAVRRVFATVGPSVVIGAVTSAAAFLVLLASPVPAHRQIGIAAGGGILGALFFALVPGPLLAAAGRRDEPAAAAEPPNPLDRCSAALFGWILRRPVAAFAAGAALVALGAAALPRLAFEPDVRRFQVRDAAVDGAQAALAGAWGDLFSQQMVVVPGPDVQTVLERTDAVSDALRPLAGGEVSAVSGTSSVMPALATQARRLVAWRAFWTPERRARVRADLAAAAAPLGIRTSTFEPFLASLDATPEPFLPERLAGTPLEAVLTRHLSVRPGDVLGLVVVAGTPPSGGATWPARVRAACPEARVLSGRGLADAVVQATRDHVSRLALPALAVVGLLLLAYYRSAVLALVALLPLVGGLVLAAGVLVVCGERLNLLNAAVALPVFGLGVDYAVFLIDAMRDAARDAPGDREARVEAVGLRMGTMVGDVLTTVAGAVAMLFASTPALFSIGLAMTAGIGGAMLVAWLTVPQVLVWTGRVPR